MNKKLLYFGSKGGRSHDPGEEKGWMCEKDTLKGVTVAEFMIDVLRSKEVRTGLKI